MSTAGFAVCTAGVEPLLKRELEQLGLAEVTEARGGVRFQGDLAGCYRAVLWSRCASRILRSLATFPCPDASALYDTALALPWEQLLQPDARFRVDVSGQAPGIEHSGFAGLKLKDAIVDRCRVHTGSRPDVERDSPDAVVHLHLGGREASIGLDLCGQPLHERGWRRQQAAAPLKETLAAALLLRAGWPEIAARGGALVDPLCGGGTLLIEGLWMAADVAPGLLRQDYTLRGLAEFDARLWQELRSEARQRADAGLASTKCRGFGFDADARVIAAALVNAGNARVAPLLRFQTRAVEALTGVAAEPGLLICNPPYGERLGEERALLPLYRTLGERLREHYGAWQTAVFSSNAELLEAIHLPVRKRHVLMNGPLRCTLVQLDAGRPRSTGPKLSAGAQMLHNRLEKNRARLHSYLAGQDIRCWRAYDADLPEYAAAIDVYTDAETAEQHLHIQEYAAPRSIPEADQERHLRELVQVAGRYFDCPAERLHLKQRARQRGTEQYRRQGAVGAWFTVEEAGQRFEVNLDDFIDSGLFLDSRILRQRLRQLARGKRFLNLFCYTASATVQAAAGGALSSLSVDLSPTYCAWAGRNFALNRLHPKAHRIVQADAVQWQRGTPERFDLIYLDPPTFSNSKRTDTVLDVQRDHVALIEDAMRLLQPGGQLLFCTNAQGFKPDPALLQRHAVEEWTRATLPPDFQRPRPIHRSFSFRAR